MRGSVFSTLVLGSLAAQAAAKQPKSCKPPVTVTEVFTVTGPPAGPGSSTRLPSSVPTPSTSVQETPSTTASPPPVQTSATTKEQSSEEPQPTTTSVEAPPPSSATTSTEAAPSSETTVKPPPSQTSSAPYADATPISVDVSATEQCGLDDRLYLPDMPWTLSNNMYGSASMVGTQCTDFNQVLEASDGTHLIEFTSVTDIERVEDTINICKGYSNFGDPSGDKHRLGDIKSIPAHFSWSRTIDEDFRGANIFDFMTSPREDAGEEPDTKEFMIFLKIWGGQRALGWADGVVDTFEFYGTKFNMYYGTSEKNGQKVYSLEPQTPFDGEFNGDLKVWMDAMVEKGYASNDEYLNHYTGGIEVFYGKSTMKATGALTLNV